MIYLYIKEFIYQKIAVDIKCAYYVYKNYKTLY